MAIDACEQPVAARYELLAWWSGSVPAVARRKPGPGGLRDRMRDRSLLSAAPRGWVRDRAGDPLGCLR